MHLSRAVAAITFVLGSLASTESVLAQSHGANAIEGAWSVEIKAINPPPGVVDFNSLITYSAGGTTVEQNGQPGFGPAVGVWEFSRGAEFNATWVKPIYNPQTGALAGRVKIRARIHMTSADEYESEDKIVFYLPDGTAAAAWNGVVKAKRIKIEPVD